VTVEPIFDDGKIVLYHGDCREILPLLGPVDVIVTDPPYGDTSLDWDRTVGGWLDLVDAPQVWCFGSMRFWLEHGHEFREHWTYGQEIVWAKHNGSSFHADRFKRVHELAVHWYRGSWSSIRHEPPLTFDATPRTVRRKRRPPHTGHIEASTYMSEDGGPRLMRSVIQCRSEHGRAQHPTQKPLGVLRPLIQYSCPLAGVVLDPFAGSGSTLLAARDLSRRAIGIEVDEGYCERALERLAQTTLDVEAVA